jgi:hypothetical protein
VAFTVAEAGDHLHAVLGGLGLASAGLAGDDDGLLALPADESLVGSSGDHIDMWCTFEISSHDLVA